MHICSWRELKQNVTGFNCLPVDSAIKLFFSSLGSTIWHWIPQSVFLSLDSTSTFLAVSICICSDPFFVTWCLMIGERSHQWTFNLSVRKKVSVRKWNIYKLLNFSSSPFLISPSFSKDHLFLPHFTPTPQHLRQLWCFNCLICLYVCLILN